MKLKASNTSRTNYQKSAMQKSKMVYFVGPQIRELSNDLNFDASLNCAYKVAWSSIKTINENFLANKRSTDYEEIVGTLLDKYNVSLKIHFLHSHF